MISEMVAENQLFFSVVCTMNDSPCISAMHWYRNHVFFLRDYSDIPKQLLAYSEDENMLRAVSDYAKTADFGIQDMHSEFDSKEIRDDVSLPDNIPDGIKSAPVQLMHALIENSMNSNVQLKVGEVSAKARHLGENRNGQ